MKMTDLMTSGSTRGVAGALLGLVAASVAGISQAAPAEQHGSESRKGTVWVVNRDKGTLTVFCATDGARVAGPLFVGRGAHDVCLSERAGKAYVTAETDNVVTAVDLETLATESIPVAPGPHHCEPSRDGRTLYVTLASHTVGGTATPTYATIDTKDHSGPVQYVTTSLDPAARAHGPNPSPDGRTVYVAHDVGNQVTRVDTDTGAVTFLASIPRAEESILSRFGRLLWVSARGDDTVRRIDLETNQMTPIPVGHEPESLMLTPSERTLVTSLRGTPAALSFVDTVDLARPAELVPIAGAGTFGDLAVISRDGRFVYATFDAGSAGTGGVAVVDVHTRRVVDTWLYPETGRPHGIWYSNRTRCPSCGSGEHRH
jgi:DNA-binding beta-propeller fold protein YncE